MSGRLKYLYAIWYGVTSEGDNTFAIIIFEEAKINKLAICNIKKPVPKEKSSLRLFLEKLYREGFRYLYLANVIGYEKI